MCYLLTEDGKTIINTSVNRYFKLRVYNDGSANIIDDNCVTLFEKSVDKEFAKRFLKELPKYLNSEQTLDVTSLIEKVKKLINDENERKENS